MSKLTLSQRLLHLGYPLWLVHCLNRQRLIRYNWEHNDDDFDTCINQFYQYDLYLQPFNKLITLNDLTEDPRYSVEINHLSYQIEQALDPLGMGNIVRCRYRLSNNFRPTVWLTFYSLANINYQDIQDNLVSLKGQLILIEKRLITR